ncbi:MAG TPA: hypothetical protein VLN74_10495 [Ilumatobacteraceae bacterium]|nr:hypothetical protein [Ilumatobacteraceae bacterium]
MRKMMLTLTTVGLLAVPTGMALAQSDTPEPTGPVPTCVDPQQDRDRDRDRTADQTGQETQEQQRIQQRTQQQLHDGTCDGDCTGDQAQHQYRMQDQAHMTDGAMHRQGPMGHADNG